MEEIWTLVTGGAKRLGAGICLALAEKRMPILVHYNTSALEAQKVAAECRAFGVSAEVIQGDFSTSEGVDLFVKQCLRRFPLVGNLINNVGNYLVKSAAETSPEEWNTLFQTNLNAPFALSHGLLSGIRNNRGSIINIGVVGAGRMAADTYSTAYLTSKTALWMLTKSLAKELAPALVRVNMVSPGYIENATDLPEDIFSIPMHRPATVSEIARVVAFLMDEKSNYITGQNIEIGGGVRL